MQALTLMVVYILTLISTQFVGFLISRVIDYGFPSLSVIAFLVLFISAFAIAWPPAVWIAEWLIRARGYTVQTQQSGRPAA